MRENIDQKLKQYAERKKKRRNLFRVVAMLSVMVAVVTSLSLMMPGETMERETLCGIAEHQHTDACYALGLVCGEEERADETVTVRAATCTFVPHVHTDDCYDKDGNLVCGYSTKYFHRHTDACYDADGSLVCPLKENIKHNHGAACYETTRPLICTQEESDGHVHTTDCYMEMQNEEPTCGLVCSEGHVHSADCYTDVLACSREESAGHVHTDACYSDVTELTCTVAEGEGAHHHDESCYEYESSLICSAEEHAHTDACYDEEGNMSCGRDEHTHGGDCYATEQVLICGQKESDGHVHSDDCYTTRHELACTVAEGEGAHTHTADCYTRELICGLAEGEGAHTHTDACYPAEMVLTCGLTEGEGAHHHSDECYNEERKLTCGYPEWHEHTKACFDKDGHCICGMVEYAEHKHTADCFTEEETLIPGHAHTDECYATCLLCDLEEHTHTDACYPAPTEEPASEPTSEPEEEATAEPTEEPESEPTSEPEEEATAEPTEEPTSELTSETEGEATAEPTEEPTSEPTSEPEGEATAEPTEEPASELTSEPEGEATAEPTEEPASELTSEPEEAVTAEPTEEPASEPTAELEEEATAEPTEEPTSEPTAEPTEEPAPSDTEEVSNALPTLMLPIEPTETPVPVETPAVFATLTDLDASNVLEMPIVSNVPAIGVPNDNSFALLPLPMGCGLAEHTHSDDCYDADGQLGCAMEEHTHTTACFGIMTLEESAAAGDYILGEGEVTVRSPGNGANGNLKPDGKGGYKCEFDVHFSVAQSVCSAHDRVVYIKLGDGIAVPEKLFGPLYPGMDNASPPQQAFEFTAVRKEDGNYIRIEFLEEYYNTYIQTHAGGKLSGTVVFDGTVIKMEDGENGKHEVNIIDKIGNTVIDDWEIKDNTENPSEKYDVSINKRVNTYNKTENCMEYTVEVSSVNGTRDAVNIRDVLKLPAGVNFKNVVCTAKKYENNNLTQDNIPVNVQHSVNNNQVEMNWTAPKLDANAKYVYTYKVYFDKRVPNGKQFVNRATAITPGEGDNNIIENTGDTYFDVHYNNIVNKSGKYENGTITWTLTVNRDKFDISNSILKDEMFKLLDGNRVLDLKIEKEDGTAASEHTDYEYVNNGDNTFSIRFLAPDGQKNNNQYKITYTTEAKPTWPGQPVINGGDFDGEHFETSLTPQEGGIHKKYLGEGDGGAGTVKWQIVINVPAGGIPENSILKDNMNFTPKQYLNKEQAAALLTAIGLLGLNESYDVTFIKENNDRVSSGSITDADVYTGFEISFPQGIPGDESGKTLTLIYETTLGDLSAVAPGAYYSYKNRVDLAGRGDEDYTENKQNNIDFELDKKLTNTEKVDNSDGDDYLKKFVFTWTTDFTVPVGGFKPAYGEQKTVLEDKIGYQTWQDNKFHHMTYDQAQALFHAYLMVTKTNGEIVQFGPLDGENSDVYIEFRAQDNDGFHKEPNSSKQYIDYRIVFPNGTPDDWQKVSLTYNTTGFVYADSMGTLIYRNDANLLNKSDHEQYDYNHRISRVEKIGNGGSTNATIQLDGTLAWEVRIYPQSEDPGEIKIEDTLPEGLEIESLRVGYYWQYGWSNAIGNVSLDANGKFDQDVRAEGSFWLGCHASGQIETVEDGRQKLTMTLKPNITDNTNNREDSGWNFKNPTKYIAVKYTCRLSDELKEQFNEAIKDSTEDLPTQEYKFANTVDVIENDFPPMHEEEEITTTVQGNKKVHITKQHRYDYQKREVSYEIVINPNRKDYGVDPLKLEDVLSYVNGIYTKDVYLKPETVALYYIKTDNGTPVIGADGKYVLDGTVPNSKWSFDVKLEEVKKQSQNKQIQEWNKIENNNISVYLISDENIHRSILNVKVPNQTALVLKYTYHVDLEIPQQLKATYEDKKDGWINNGDICKAMNPSLDISNEATLSGGKDTATDTTNKDKWEEANASGTFESKGYRFRKISASQQNMMLPGATFKVYVCTSNEIEGVAFTDGNGEEVFFTTGDDGKFMIDCTQNDETKITREVTGDSIAIEPGVLYYVQEVKAPLGYLLPEPAPKYYFFHPGTPATIPQQVKDGKVNAVNLLEGASVVVKNERNDLTVEKEWFKDGKKTNVDGSVKFELFRYTDTVEHIVGSAKVTVVYHKPQEGQTVTETRVFPWGAKIDVQLRFSAYLKEANIALSISTGQAATATWTRNDDESWKFVVKDVEISNGTSEITIHINENFEFKDWEAKIEQFEFTNKDAIRTLREECEQKGIKGESLGTFLLKSPEWTWSSADYPGLYDKLYPYTYNEKGEKLYCYYWVEEDKGSWYDGYSANNGVSGGIINLENRIKGEKPVSASLRIEKKWLDADGTPYMPKQTVAAAFTIYRQKKDGGEPIKGETVTLDGSKGWVYEWHNTLDASYNYWVVEEGITDKGEDVSHNYKATYNGFINAADAWNNGGSIEIVNQKHEEGKISVTVNKMWLAATGDELSDNGLPEITVALYRKKHADDAEGEKQGEATLRASGWKHTWTGLDKKWTVYKDVEGELQEDESGFYTYYVEEIDLPDNFAVAILPQDITAEDVTTSLTFDITNTKQTVDIPVKKVWMGKDGQPMDASDGASVTLQLMQDGAPYQGNAPVTLSGDNWSYTFMGLPYKAETEGAAPYVYSVEEIACIPAGFKPMYAQNGEGVYTVTNTEDTMDIPVKKVWQDANGGDLTSTAETAASLPESITVSLIRYKVPDGQQQTFEALTTREARLAFWDADHTPETYTLTRSNNWQHTFTNLPRLAIIEGGLAYYYYDVEEAPVPGYTPEYSVAEDNTLVITNTPSGDVTEFKVRKKWVDADGVTSITDPDEEYVEVTLRRNDSEGNPDETFVYEDVPGVNSQQKQLSAATDWSASWPNLEKYDANNNPYVYYVEETELPGWLTTYGEDAENNCHLVVNRRNKTSISVNKVWNDAANALGKRPENITVKLMYKTDADSSAELVDFKDVQGKSIVAAVKLSGESWSHTWDNLPSYSQDENGQLVKYIYSVVEEEVNGYTAEVTDNGDGTFIITNTPYTDIAVEKKWTDIRADANEVKFKLYQYASSDGTLPPTVTDPGTGDGETVDPNDLVTVKLTYDHNDGANPQEIVRNDIPRNSVISIVIGTHNGNHWKSSPTVKINNGTTQLIQTYYKYKPNEWEEISIAKHSGILVVDDVTTIDVRGDLWGCNAEKCSITIDSTSGDTPPSTDPTIPNTEGWNTIGEYTIKAPGWTWSSDTEPALEGKHLPLIGTNESGQPVYYFYKVVEVVPDGKAWTVEYSDTNEGTQDGTITITNTPPGPPPADAWVRMKKEWTLPGGTQADSSLYANATIKVKLQRYAVPTDQIASFNPADLNLNWQDAKFNDNQPSVELNANNTENWTYTFSDLEKTGTNETGVPVTYYYYVVEVESPSGFHVANDSAHKHGVLPNSDTDIIILTNELTQYTLPETGGPGTYWYTLGGMLLMAAAAAALLYKRNRGKGGLSDQASFARGAAPQTHD